MQETFMNTEHCCRHHRFELPLDHDTPSKGTISVFARELVHRDKVDAELPWLVYLQGGPGFPSPRPNGHSGWLKRALSDYRVLLLDQRGTGSSTVINHQTLHGKSPAEQAEYLSHFRADSIVKDAEAIRESLGIKQWALLGQSYGGFCALTYLSFFPKSLSRVFTTGGIPSIHRHPDEVYTATYRQMLDKNDRFFRRFPEAQQLCNTIAAHLEANEVALPNGQRFTVEQFQLIGVTLGRGDGEMTLYYLLESAFIEVNGVKELSYQFLSNMQAQQSFLTNPIYAILHESIYCQGTSSRWSAHRVRDQYPRCHYSDGEDFSFTGEMVYPWMFEQLETLKPMRDAADILAEKENWPPLYSPEQLAKNEVPLAAAVYVEDMYVPFDFSRETLSSMPNAEAWMTNEYEHNGLGADGERILERLMTIANTIEDLPENRARC